MTEELIKQLMAAGLKKSQANSVATEMIVQALMNEDGKLLIKEAKQQVTEMKDLVNRLKSEYEELQIKINALSETVLAIKDAQKEYGNVSDEKAKNVIALYGSLMSINERSGVSPTEAVNNAGYVLYAYLGGQAKREIAYNKKQDDNDEHYTII